MLKLKKTVKIYDNEQHNTFCLSSKTHIFASTYIDVKMEFKKLELKQEGTWIKRTLKSVHVRKSALFILGGMVLGLGYTFFTEGNSFANVPADEIFKNVLTGGFLGFFITNSPCSRGKC
ncbi:MAG: hypothetical protein JEZ09_07630 [Salinivirgaceae bacterium]|nr:hypothetical protein [Salinivirgaceae bacterium]